MNKHFMLASVALAVAASPASAAPAGVSACAITDISPTAIACTGFFDGNLLSSSPGDITAQKNGLSPLGLAWDGLFANVTKINSLNEASIVNWSTADQNPLTTMYGDTWVGFHYGGGSAYGNGTAFYRFNATIAGLQQLMLTAGKGSSGAVLYKTGVAPPPPPPAVPEPASWAMMIAGFGLIGATMRRRSMVVA